MQKSCVDKIGEAEEHLQYLQVFLPDLLENEREDIQRATVDYARGNYELCLSKATISKANINTVLSTIGIAPEDVNELLALKLKVAKRSIISQQDSFPVLAYSYYEYASSLGEESPYSALLYAEYALELSNLDIYFDSFNSIPSFDFAKSGSFPSNTITLSPNWTLPLIWNP
mgnify:CR=1 FL=1